MKLIALMKKEFRRFVHDPRLIVTMLIPGLIIYLIYSILGDALWSKEQDTRTLCGGDENGRERPALLFSRNRFEGDAHARGKDKDDDEEGEHSAQHTADDLRIGREIVRDDIELVCDRILVSA